MKGPGLRIGLDVRREWRCPQCGRVVRLSGDVTAQGCPCIDPPVWMTLLPPVKREKPKFERIVIAEDPEPEPEPEPAAEAPASEPAVAAEPEAIAEDSATEATPETSATEESPATAEPPRREENSAQRGPREGKRRRDRDRNRNRDRGPRPESPQSLPREHAIESVPPDSPPPSAGQAEAAPDEGFGEGIE